MPPARVLVFGSGFAGLTAALSAAEAGAAVTLVEKAPDVGGTSALSGGLVWTWANLAAMQSAIPAGNPVLQELVHRNAEPARQWLTERRVQFGAHEEVFGYGWGQRLVDPVHAIRTLVEELDRLGVEIRTDTALESLGVAEGRVAGAAVADATGRVRVMSTDAVVLATGGFHGSPDLVARYLGSPGNLLVRANSWNTGDGLLAATGAGAALTPGLDTFYGHAMAAPPAPIAASEFREATQSYGMQAVALNADGIRFTDETFGTGEEELNQALFRQRGGRGFYVVDAAVAEREARPRRPIIRVLLEWARKRGAPFVQADTLAELARGLAAYGVPPERSLRTLEEFNAACVSGSFDSMAPTRLHNREPLLRPPFFAVGVKAAITFTMGGIAVDENAAVLRRGMSSSPLAQSITDVREFREAPIPGLFAAGSDVGNISNQGYAGGIASAIVLGRLAGRNAAR